MTRPSPEIEQLAGQRLAADEQRITESRRSNVSLGAAWRSFWRARSPWLVAIFLAGAVAARLTVGGGSLWELAIPAALVALFPVIEWVIHVVILHWRPRRVGPVAVDSLLAR
ncbi:MAG: fatty acid hydroxylase, partial [Nocardioides sp.]|nr:fatty acid hydroxylase [Nocardioides sp.]